MHAEKMPWSRSAGKVLARVVGPGLCHAPPGDIAVPEGNSLPERGYARARALLHALEVGADRFAPCASLPIRHAALPGEDPQLAIHGFEAHERSHLPRIRAVGFVAKAMRFIAVGVAPSGPAGRVAMASSGRLSSR